VKKKTKRPVVARFFGYECPECGNDTWLAAALEKFIYCAHCGGDEGKLTLSKIPTTHIVRTRWKSSE
jgi:ribosomal protein S27AE